MAIARLLCTVLAAALLVDGYPQTPLPPFTSLKAPAETIRNYEVHTPSVLNEEREGGQLLSFDLQVSHYLVHLELNRDLISPQFVSHHYGEDGTTVEKKGHRNCFYHGSVSGHPEWHVAMSTCHGLQGSFGELGTASRHYHLEPLNSTNPSTQQPHALYSSDEYSVQEGTCGVSGHHKITQHSAIPHAFHVDKHRVRRLVNGFYIVEWAMINDFAQFTSYDSNTDATVMRALEIANAVDSLYRTLMVRVVVVHMITWSGGNRIAYPPNFDSNVLLENLDDFEPQIVPVHDSTMLITGEDLEGNTVGKAFVGTMCRPRSSVGLSQDRQGPVDNVASIAAHELGHIFSLNHDDDISGCTCTDPSGNCIMSAVSGRPSPTIWSGCSRTAIANAFVTNRLDRCLGNEPLVTVGDPVCGNGIRERDEICDCGTPLECTDPCCNATSCMLNAGAQCSDGDCCTPGCLFRPRGTVCRAVSQQCDLAEFCMGDSSSCPQDTYLQDGSPCNADSDFCYSGICQTVDDQCQRFFGSVGGPPECATRFNTDGDTGGNCGFVGNGFRACQPEDALCGSLQCVDGEFMGGVTGAGTLRITRHSAGGTLCVTFSSFPGSDTANPGLVADGTRCGNASICVSQSCVALSNLAGVQSCPTDPDGLVCSGAGACNNLNQCSCDGGNPDPACVGGAGGAEGGSGGGNAGVIAGALVGVLLGIALAVGVIVAVVLIGKKLYSSKHGKSYLSPPKQTSSTVNNNINQQSVSGSSAPFVAYRPQAQSSPRAPPARPPTTPSTPRTRPSAPPTARGRQAPSAPAKAAPSAPSKPSYPPPSKPSYPPPSKPNPPPSRSNPPPRKPNPPPPTKPAASNKPPPAAPRPGRIQQQWPPPDSASDAEKPAPPKKPVFPPRR